MHPNVHPVDMSTWNVKMELGMGERSRAEYRGLVQTNR